MSDAKGRTEEAKGHVEEAAGVVADDDELRDEGKSDRAAGKAKQKIEQVRTPPRTRSTALATR